MNPKQWAASVLNAKRDDVAPPYGLTITELLVALRLQSRSNAQQRMSEMMAGGFFERKLIATGKGKPVYQYRQTKRFACIQDAFAAARNRQPDAPPKGWTTARLAAKKYKVSPQSIHQMAIRGKVPSHFRRLRNTFGSVRPVRVFKVDGLDAEYARLSRSGRRR